MKKSRQIEPPSIPVLCLFLSILLFSCVQPQRLTPSLPGEHLTILYINDLHGELEPFALEQGKKVGGAARLASLIDKIREENRQIGRHTLFLVAGDVFLGTSMSAFFQGEAEFKFLNQISPDAMTVGNHEFDFGWEVLQRRVATARFPIISANIYRSGQRSFPPLLVKELGGRLRLVVLGLITPDTARIANPSTISGLTFADPVAEAKKIAVEADRRKSIFIGLTHTGLEIDKRLAAEVPELDVIVGGHDHIALPEPLKIGRTLITQAENRGLFLGRLDVFVEGGQLVKTSGRLIPITEELPEDKEVEQIVSSYRTELDRRLKVVLGKSNVRLIGESNRIRREETNLGNLVADIMRAAAGTEVALINGGSIRGSIEVGPITLEDIWRVFPYESRLVRLELSGKQIEEALVHSIRLPPGQSGGFLQISGLNMTIGPSGLKDIRFQTKPLEANRFYSVTVTDFMFTGGDGYEMFQKGRNYSFPSPLIRDLLISYVTQNKEISRELDGRIRRQP